MRANQWASDSHRDYVVAYCCSHFSMGVDLEVTRMSKIDTIALYIGYATLFFVWFAGVIIISKGLGKLIYLALKAAGILSVVN